MDDSVQDLMEWAREHRSISITIRLNDGDRYAGLDIDLQALAAVLFCGAVAEEIFLFGDVVHGDAPSRPSTDRLRQVAENVLARNLRWVDCFDYQDEYRNEFQEILRLRERGSGLTASPLLRLELTGIAIENPTVLKILAYGTAGAMMLLTACFATVQLYREDQAGTCRATAVVDADHKTQMIAQAARLEGRWTREHNEALRIVTAAQSAGIAACGSVLSTIILHLTKEGGIEIIASGEELRHEGAVTILPAR